MTIATVTHGSFGAIASARQGSPKGTAMKGIISSRFLGGAVRPPTVVPTASTGGVLGNIATNLPSSGAVKTQVNASGTTPTQANSQIAATKAKAGSNLTYIALGLAILVGVFIVWK